MEKNTLGQNHLPVLYPGIDINRVNSDEVEVEASLKKKEGIPEDCHVFSIIGRLDSCKNHFMFLDVANEIVRCVSKSYFIITGSYDEDDGGDGQVKAELDKRIKAMPLLAGKIIFTGFVKDIKKILRSSDIIFSCTGSKNRGESLGLTIVEAMISGRPVIATSIGGPAEIIRDGFNGFLVEPGDYKTMAKKAIFLVDSQNDYNYVVNNAKKQALEHYTVERFTKEIIDMFIN